MKTIKTLDTKNLCDSAKNGGCGECQTSCQSACKTSCGIANQQCENKKLTALQKLPPNVAAFFVKIKNTNFTEIKIWYIAISLADLT